MATPPASLYCTFFSVTVLLCCVPQSLGIYFHGGIDPVLAVQSSQTIGQSSKSASTAARRKNNCAAGKLLPEFYVIGAKNSATSSLYADLLECGVHPAPGQPNCAKEWQFFKDLDQYASDTEAMAAWLGGLIPCPAFEGNRSVLADFSVTNLFALPVPTDVPTNALLFYSKHETNAWDSARLIRQFHALLGTPIPKLIVMLREPLSRMQSEYYHTLELHNCRGCQTGDSFVDAARRAAASLTSGWPGLSGMSDWAWKSMYSRQIEEFLKYFPAEQFYIVPRRQYYEYEPINFSTNIISWLELDAKPWDVAYHMNNHNKPDLDEELPPGDPVRERIQGAFAEENERLVQTLAMASREGMNLAGYTGPLGDVDSTRTWLYNGW